MSLIEKERDADGDIWALYEHLEDLSPRRARLYSIQIEVEIKNVSNYLVAEVPEVVNQVFPTDTYTYRGRKDEIGEIVNDWILNSLRSEAKNNFKILVTNGANFKKELLKCRLTESLFSSGLRKHFDTL